MRLKLQTSSLRATTVAEYAKRFVFGGVVTVAASLIAEHYGPIAGGLFLAFPGIFPPGVTLVERHKIEREAAEGKSGVRAARAEASVEAAGASIGALGLIAFAIVLWKLLPGHSLALTLLVAGGAWLLTAWMLWWVRELL